MGQLIPTRALTPQIGLGLLGWPSRGYLRSGGARLGRSQKDGLLSAAREKGQSLARLKAIDSR
jgi:hypothetical protein